MIYLVAYVVLVSIAAALAPFRPRTHGEITMENPLTALAMAAAATHEMYEAYIKAGFTPDQAMEIVKHSIEVAARYSQGNGQ